MGDERERSRYSPDGKWWWDGEQWQPAGGALQVSGPPPRDPPYRRPWLVYGVALWVLSVGSLVGLAAFLGVQLAHALLTGGIVSAMPGHSAVHHSPRPSATISRPSPTPALSQRQLAVRYTQLLTIDGQRIDRQFAAVDQECARPGELPTCRAALVSLQGTVHGFQKDLAESPVPDCLRSTNGQLEDALALFDQGTGRAISGIDRQDPTQIVAATQLIQQANDRIDQLRTQTPPVRC